MVKSATTPFATLTRVLKRLRGRASSAAPRASKRAEAARIHGRAPSTDRVAEGCFLAGGARFSASAFLADDVRHGGTAHASAVVVARRAACVWAAVLLTTALTAGVAIAKPLDLDGHDWEGLSDFLQAAHEEIGDGRVIATSTLDFDDVKKEDGIVLVHPERSLDVESLASFMRSGGRVVLLDDFGTGDALLRHFGLQRVPMPSRPAEFLRNNPQFAIAEPAGTHPVVRDVAKLVTNHPTGLRHPDLSPVLKLRGIDEPDVLLAEAGAVGEGRLLAVGDSSVVMNSMLRFPGNRAFARGIVRYAVEDDNRFKRSGRLFVASGAFEQKGSFGEREGFAKEWHERARDAGDALRTAQKDGLPPSVAYTLAILVGLGIVLWVGARAGRTHRASPPRFTRGISILAQGGMAGHAAVIGAPKTSRALALLELKSALEEGLAGALGLELVPSHEELTRRVSEARILDADGMRTLKDLLLRMASVETMVLSRRTDAMERVRDRDVVEAAVMVKKVLSLAENRGAGSAAGERAPA